MLDAASLLVLLGEALLLDLEQLLLRLFGDSLLLRLILLLVPKALVKNDITFCLDLLEETVIIKQVFNLTLLIFI